MKRLFKDVSVSEIFVVVFFVGLFVFVGVAEASNYKKSERGAVEQVQNQDIYIEDNDTQQLGVDARQTTTTNNDIGVGAEATSSNDGNRQEIGISQNYAERAFKGLLTMGIGNAHVYSESHSDPECQRQVKAEKNWFGMHGHGEVVETDEECVKHKRQMEIDLIALEKAKLLHDLGYISEAAEMLGAGGDKYTPSQLQSLEKEVAEYREKKVHGDLYK